MRYGRFFVCLEMWKNTAVGYQETQDIYNILIWFRIPGEIVLFCRPTKFQLELYQQLLQSQLVRSCLSRCMSGSPHLVCIAALKQLCNHPSLVYHKAKDCTSSEHTEDSVSFLLLCTGLDNIYAVTLFLL